MFHRISDWCQTHKKMTVILLTFAVVLSLFVVSRSQFSSNILDLLPVKDRVIAQHFTVLSLFNTIDKIVIEVSSLEENKPFAQLAQFSHRLIDSLTATEEFTFPDAITPSDYLTLRNYCIELWPALFTKQDSLYLVKRLNYDSLQAGFTRRIASLFSFSDGTTDQSLLQNDPFDISMFSLAKLATLKPIEQITIKDGLITNPTEDRILIFAQIAQEGMDESAARRARRIIEVWQAKAKAQDIEVAWMGAPRASLDNADTIKKDVHKTLPVALIAVFLICLGVYRRVSYGLLTFIPTLVGILFTLALFLFFGKLSIIILGFGAALLGITVDYAIHYLYHISESPQDPHPVKTLAGPIFASAFTTAGAFLVLIVADIPGLSQLGLVTSVGILLVALLTLTLLPLLHNRADKKTASPRIALPRYFSRFYKKGYDKAFFVLLIICAVILLFCIPRLQFDGNPNSLNGMSSETKALEARLNKEWPGMQKGAFLIVSDSTLDAVCQQVEQQITPLVSALADQGYINPVEPFTTLMPSKSIQKKNNTRWNHTVTPKILKTMQTIFTTVSKEYGLDPTPFLTYTKNIRTNEFNENQLHTNLASIIEQGLFKNYLRNTDSVWYANVPIIPTTDTAWANIEKAARSYNVLAVNDALLGIRVVQIIRTGFFRCLIFIPFVIFIVLLCMLRNWRLVGIAFVPVILAAITTMGMLACIGVAINIVTIMIFAFIFGLGIDYTLLMLFMSKKSLIIQDHKYVPQAAASITIAAGTTCVGLGILVIAKHPVLSSVGTSGLVGIFASYISAIVVVPLLVQKFVISKN